MSCLLMCPRFYVRTSLKTSVYWMIYPCKIKVFLRNYLFRKNNISFLFNIRSLAWSSLCDATNDMYCEENVSYWGSPYIFACLRSIVWCHNSIYLQNGALSAVPYIFFWAFINIGGNLADAFRSRGWKTATVRKISLCMGKSVCACWFD